MGVPSQKTSTEAIPARDANQPERTLPARLFVSALAPDEIARLASGPLLPATVVGADGGAR